MESGKPDRVSLEWQTGWGSPNGNLSVNSMEEGTREPGKSVTPEEASEAEAKAGKEAEF